MYLYKLKQTTTMTYQQVIEQTKTFTTQQRRQLAYYLLYPTLQEDKKKKFEQLFDFKIEYTDILKESVKPLDNLLKYTGILKNVDISDITEEELYLQGD